MTITSDKYHYNDFIFHSQDPSVPVAIKLVRFHIGSVWIELIRSGNAKDTTATEMKLHEKETETEDIWVTESNAIVVTSATIICPRKFPPTYLKSTVRKDYDRSVEAIISKKKKK